MYAHMYVCFGLPADRRTVRVCVHTFGVWCQLSIQQHCAVCLCLDCTARVAQQASVYARHAWYADHERRFVAQIVSASKRP